MVGRPINTVQMNESLPGWVFLLVPVGVKWSLAEFEEQRCVSEPVSEAGELWKVG